jgi:outer membrane protein OmpA-like peptidoglycan-associated protein
MKNRYIYILLALFVTISLGVSAQKHNGGIDATDLILTKTGNAVVLEMTLHVAADAVDKSQSVAVIPSLADSTRTVNFPYVLVNGRKAKNIFARHNKFGFTELRENPPYQVVDMGKKSKSVTISYRAEIHAENYNIGASLKMGIIVASSAGERHYYTTTTTATIDCKKADSVVEVHVKVEHPNGVTERLAPQTSEPTTLIVRSDPEPIVFAEAGDHDTRGTAYLDFRTNSFRLYPDYKRNAAELTVIHRVMGQIKSNPKARITSLSIVGYASPEERYSNNEQLAYERALSVTKYLQPMYGISVRDCKVSGIAEDWVRLRELVEASNIVRKSEILQIIDSADHPDVKESKLRRVAGGRPWKVMIDTMFPVLRRVEYKVEYTIVE